MTPLKRGRRQFLKCAGMASLAGIAGCADAAESAGTGVEWQAGDRLRLDDFYRKRFVRQELLPEPVILKSMQLLKRDDNWFVRAESASGMVGLAMAHPTGLSRFYPILLQDVLPFFVGKDARGVEALVDGVYEAGYNYKMQGQAFWICVASAEFAVLDLLGRVAGKPVAELLGGILRTELPLYHANNYRHLDAEASLERIQRNVVAIGATALKLKVGGRMLRDDLVPGRTRALVPMVAAALGDRCTLYADANSSYQVPQALEVGRLLEDNGFAFFEEPVPFDFLDATRQVADALRIPIAGGEQESSLWRFWWLIAHRAVQIAQPDLFYFGGLIRSLRVAAMAESAGIVCVPHISGLGMNFLYSAVFGACAPALGPHQEYKGIFRDIPWVSPGVDFTIRRGIMPVPTAPGMGVDFDPDYISGANAVA
jgi:L-alanine-DL-glutamate epimerase-like enolase superfamily enzyme